MPGVALTIEATPETILEFNPENQFIFHSGQRENCREETPTNCLSNGNLILKVDIVREFKAQIKKTLSPKQATIHQILTRLPIPYGLAPAWLRDRVMKADYPTGNVSLLDKLPIDSLRFLLVNALEKSLNRKISKKALFQTGCNLLTHDIDTFAGLKRAIFLKKIEQKYDIASTWYVPSERYKLNANTICELANNGEIGSHDTKHDGKLVHLSKENMIRRLGDSKNTISNILHADIAGFRAPVLQHSTALIRAVHESGFKYDASIPTWEPKHPFTMQPHGIGTVFPIALHGTTEIPLTLPQDHQLLHVLNIGPEEALKTWRSMAIEIKDLGGITSFLVHPDYEFAHKSLDLYEEFINVMLESKTTVTLAKRLAERCQIRT